MKPKPIFKRMKTVLHSGACRFGFAYQAQVKYRNLRLTAGAVKIGNQQEV